MKTAPSSSKCVLLYPKRSKVVLGSVLYGALALGSAYFFVLALAELIGGTADVSGIVAGLFFGLLSAGFAYAASRDLRQLIWTRPLLRLDDAGVECRLGRVEWADVERVSADNATVTIRLRLDAQPHRTATAYHGAEMSGDVGRLAGPWYEPKSPTTAHGIYITGGQREQTLDAIRRFYTGEIGKPLPGEGREPSGGGGV